MDALAAAGVLLPTLGMLGVAWIKSDRRALLSELRGVGERVGKLETELDRVRKRSHDVVGEVQRLPTSLRPYFVDRGEWTEAQKAGDAIHLDHGKRISDLEAGR